MVNLEDIARGVIETLGVNASPEEVNKVAKKHAALGAAAGAIPIPGASAVAVAANIWYMYKEINNTLGLKFSDNKLKTIISGVVSNIGSTVLLTVGAGELLKFLPGFGSVTGAAIEAAIDAAITYTAAFIYLKAISVLAFRKAENISDDDLKNEIDLYMKNNKDEVKKVFSDAKNTFKKDKSIINNKEATQELEKMRAEQEATEKRDSIIKEIVKQENISTAVSLKKGQKVDLTKGHPGLSRIMVGLGWDTNKYTGGADFDLDAAAFLLGANGKVTNDADFVFYNNLKHPSGSVTHMGDNLIGGGGGDDEQIEVDLSKVTANIDKIAFTVTIYDAENRQQNFGQVSNAFIRVVDLETNKEVIRFDLGEDFSVETAVVVGELYRRGADWKFNAIGSGFAGGLAAIGENFGVDIA